MFGQERTTNEMKGRQRRLKYTHTHAQRGDSWAQNIVRNYVITQNSQRRRRRQCHMSVPVPLCLCPSRCTRRQLAQRQVDAAAAAAQDTTSYKTSQGKKLRAKYLTDTKTMQQQAAAACIYLKYLFLLTCHRSLTAR